jgi:hypothetical protein
VTKKLSGVFVRFRAPSSFKIGNIKTLKMVKEDRSRIRSHFALDFGEQKKNHFKQTAKLISEKQFTPFRPFVLASTSIGQEGLDFLL